MMEISNQEPTPVAKSALFVDSLYRGGTLLRIFMTDFLRSRKSKGLVIVGLLPTIIVILTQAGLDRPQIFYYDVFTTIYVTFLLPLFGLLLGTAAISDEMESHTIVQLVSRPLWRVEIIFWRYLATLLASMIIVLVVIGGFTSVFILFASLDAGVFIGAMMASLVCVSVYCSVFMLLGLALKKALLWGTLLVLYEQGLGVLVTFVGGPALSLSGHILNVGTSFLNYYHSIPGWTVTMSAQLLAIITLACILLSMLVFRIKDLS
jgi:ABC-2 type transport system permease protein